MQGAAPPTAGRGPVPGRPGAAPVSDLDPFSKEYFDDPYLCIKGADAMVVVTEWVQYRTLDLARLRAEMAQPVLVDLRNIYRRDDMASSGFFYESVGRSPLPR